MRGPICLNGHDASEHFQSRSELRDFTTAIIRRSLFLNKLRLWENHLFKIIIIYQNQKNVLFIDDKWPHQALRDYSMSPAKLVNNVSVTAYKIKLIFLMLTWRKWALHLIVNTDYIQLSSSYCLDCSTLISFWGKVSVPDRPAWL